MIDDIKDKPAAANVAEADPAKAQGQGSEGEGHGGRGKQKKRRGGQRRQRTQRESDFLEKVVSVNRVSKVVQGGKNFSFAALVVVGDGKGKVGFCVGKAREVQDAIQKGLLHAKNRMVSVSLAGTTIPHDILIRFNAAKVMLKPASQGTGIIAGAAVRSVCECAGIKDVLTKSLGSQTPLNVVQATLKGLMELRAPIVHPTTAETPVTGAKS